MGALAEHPKFEVFLSGMPGGSLEDWRRAVRAPSSELDGLLTEDDKAFARKFGIAEEDYARGRLLHSYGKERMKKRGEVLGRAVEEILGGIGPNYRLLAVIYESNKPRWVVRIWTPQKIVNVAIDHELGDDIVNSNTIQDQERLRELLQSSIERSEQIGKR